MSEATEATKDQPCNCVLCRLSRDIEAATAAGPKEPRDDDDDSDDDKEAAELCDCKECVPGPVAAGEDLKLELANALLAAKKNDDSSAKYGQSLTRGLMAKPLPAEFEAVLLQFAVDSWNACDRAACDLSALIVKYDPEGWAETSGKERLPRPKTLEAAVGFLAKQRAKGPQRKGHDDNRKLRDLLLDLLNGSDVGNVDVEVIKVDL